MSVRVTIVDGAVGASDGRPTGGMVAAPGSHASGAGAVLTFEGIVRAIESGEAIVGLEYEAYEPMATRQMERIARGLVEELGVLSIEVWHSRGRVAVGQRSLLVVVSSRHRKEGLEAMDRFIDALKRDVPIWKKVAGRS